MTKILALFIIFLSIEKAHAIELSILPNDVTAEILSYLDDKYIAEVISRINKKLYKTCRHIRYFNSGLNETKKNNKDFKRARKLLRHSNKIKQLDSHKLFQILTNLDDKKSFFTREVISWFKNAAKTGDSLALNNLGYIYRNGLGVKQDLNKAHLLYQLSANKGNAFGQFNLGVMYEQGLGVGIDLNRAIGLYRLSAEQNTPEALSHLGYLYKEGHGVSRDLQEACRLLNLSVEFGNTTALDTLANMYAWGIGVTQDTEEANRIFGLSAKISWQSGKSL